MTLNVGVLQILLTVTDQKPTKALETFILKPTSDAEPRKPQLISFAIWRLRTDVNMKYGLGSLLEDQSVDIQ